MCKRNGPAAGGTAVRAGIDNARRRSDTTPSPAPQIDLADARFQRAVAWLHRLGPRALAEFLIELGAGRMLRTEIEEMLARYNARLDPKILRAVGGDRFTRIPLRLVASPEKR